ncbi:MAG TPA: hypothetical protein VFF30_08085 [Nitrososphaerales archaeon]|nr:hypothetical protein [Nitrososphaerales archaeon]
MSDSADERHNEISYDPMLSSRFRYGSCNVNGRVFVIEILIETNGCIAVVSENPNPRLGGITLSVKTDRRVASSSSLIPERKGSMLASMLGEMLADKLGGIALISLYLREEIEAETMKTLINKVRKMLDRDLTPAV